MNQELKGQCEHGYERVWERCPQCLKRERDEALERLAASEARCAAMDRERNEAAFRMEAAEKRALGLEAALRALEWEPDTSRSAANHRQYHPELSEADMAFCHVCRRRRFSGHVTGCRLSAALSAPGVGLAEYAAAVRSAALREAAECCQMQMDPGDIGASFVNAGAARCKRRIDALLALARGEGK